MKNYDSPTPCWVMHAGSFIIGYASDNLPDGTEVARAPLRSGFLGSAGMFAAMVVTFLPLAAAVWIAARL